MRSNYLYIIICILLVIHDSCQQKDEKRFRKVPSKESGITFRNDLNETVDFNIFNYLYFYNGGGVAVGDLNGDGLMDLYFTSNQNPNKLYLNKGALKFDDITHEAGVAGYDSWSTGVSIADVNGDGLLDIYVCYLGEFKDYRSKNQLFINLGNNENGIPVFEDQAIQFGLDLVGFSTQAVFFDYDLDGDLDLFMLNHSVHNNGTFGKSTLRYQSHELSGDKLLRNDNGRFVDVTESSGIYSSVIGYGLGVVVSDINLDGYPDLYIGNDFHENDYLYINNGDGTFKESLKEQIMHTSHFSMGVDAADFNNDGFPDIFTLDMLPEDPKILKASAAEDPYDVFNFKLSYGYTHQFARNNLQLNNGNGTFSEIGLFAGVEATDWSWSTFFADLDLDGKKDIYVANGVVRRSNDLDYINFITTEDIQMRLKQELTQAELNLVENMPRIRLPNFAFRNNGDSTFANVSEIWGLNYESYSNGAVYVDLDNDGDLDLVVNNINDEAFVFENRTIVKGKSQSNYIQVSFEGEGKNKFGIGTKVFIYHGGEVQYQEVSPVRGFQSSVDYRLTFGLNSLEIIDSLLVIWPDFSFEKQHKLKANQVITLKRSQADGRFDYSSFSKSKNLLLIDVTNSIGLDFEHKEQRFVEFTREPLIPHMFSMEGPAVAVADINGDGLDDVFFGGAKWQSSEIYIQAPNGKFSRTQQIDIQADSINEDVSAIFSDLNNNGFKDLIVVSGGNEFSGNVPQMLVRLYINDGNGDFKRENSFPSIYTTGSVVDVADFDGDGDVDIFIGSRTTPNAYGLKPDSYLLENKGGGKFVDVTLEKAPELKSFGFVKDGKWMDLNKDGLPDLIVAAEWSPISIFKNIGGRLELVDSEASGLKNTNGWWNTIIPFVSDNKGHSDFIIGNLGKNSKFRASELYPVRMYFNDFDDNGTHEQVLSHYLKGKEFPFNTKDELLQKMPSLKKKYLSYSKFAEADLQDIFGEKLKSAKVFEVQTFASVRVKNLGNFKFEVEELPSSVQFSPLVSGISLNATKSPEVILGGNFYPVNVQRGRYDASYGTYLKQNEAGELEALSSNISGLSVKGEVRNIKIIIINGITHLIFVRNNDKPIIMKINDQDGKTQK
jgi:enediyne biosynthesis protein E4